MEKLDFYKHSFTKGDILCLKNGKRHSVSAVDFESCQVGVSDGTPEKNIIFYDLDQIERIEITDFAPIKPAPKCKTCVDFHIKCGFMVDGKECWKISPEMALPALRKAFDDSCKYSNFADFVKSIQEPEMKKEE